MPPRQKRGGGKSQLRVLQKTKQRKSVAVHSNVGSCFLAGKHLGSCVQASCLCSSLPYFPFPKVVAKSSWPLPAVCSHTKETTTDSLALRRKNRAKRLAVQKDKDLVLGKTCGQKVPKACPRELSKVYVLLFLPKCKAPPACPGTPV